MIATTTLSSFIKTSAQKGFTVVEQQGQGEDPLTHYYAFAHNDLMGYCAVEGDYAPGDICETKRESRQMECDVCHPRFTSHVTRDRFTVSDDVIAMRGFNPAGEE